MLGHETVIDTDAVSVFHCLRMRSGLDKHRTDNRCEPQPKSSDAVGSVKGEEEAQRKPEEVVDADAHGRAGELVLPQDKPGLEIVEEGVEYLHSHEDGKSFDHVGLDLTHTSAIFRRT